MVPVLVVGLSMAAPLVVLPLKWPDNDALGEGEGNNPGWGACALGGQNSGGMQVASELAEWRLIRFANAICQNVSIWDSR